MISQSQINTYINCSKKYFFKYVERMKPSNDISIDGLFVGSFVHNYINLMHEWGHIIIDFYYVLFKTLQNMKIVWKDGIDIDTLNFKNVDYKKMLKEDYYKSIFENEVEKLKTKENIIINLFDTAKIICEFIKSNMINDISNLKSEERIEIDDLLVIIDALAVSENFDDIIIKDFKVSKRIKEYRKTIQDLLYVYAVYKKYNVIPKFEYILITYSNKNEVSVEVNRIEFTYTERDIEEAEDYILNFKKGIANNVFLKNNSSFLCAQDFCEYFDFCQGGSKQ